VSDQKEWVAQGTVQVTQAVKQGKLDTTIILNPTCDYKVRHKKTNYTVFVGEDKTCLMLPADDFLTVVDAAMAETLMQSAVHHLKIELLVDKDKRILSLRVPAPPVSE